MTRTCLCGQHQEHPALDPWPRQCARCGACWRCGQAWPALCQCPALLRPWTISEALSALDEGAPYAVVDHA